jgi:hypothetical protein
MFEFQGAYIQHLVDATDYPNFDIAAVNRPSCTGSMTRPKTSWAIATSPTAR